MEATADTWTLYAGEELVAGLVVTGGGFPWLEAQLDPKTGFERFRHLFDAEWQATEAEDWDAADLLYREIRDTLRLIKPDGAEVAEFLLHVQGEEAWWRWSDEPFEDE